MSFPAGSDNEEATCNVGDPVRPLSWEDPLEEGMASFSSILAWRIPRDREAWWVAVRGVKGRARLSD